MDAVEAAPLQRALDRTLELSLIDDDWRRALSCFSEAAGAAGAVLVRERPARKPVLLSTASIAEPVAAYAAGQAPPDQRAARVWPEMGGGFVADLDCFSRAEIERDMFYAEFLRPLGLGWHACALLAERPGGERLYLSLKRRFRAGHYQRAELRLLDAALPRLRLAHDLAGLRSDLELGLSSRSHAERGRAIFHIGQDGRARALNETAGKLVGTELHIRQGRIFSQLPGEQAKIDRLLATARLSPARSGLAVLATATASRRLILRAVALTGESRAIFGTAGLLLTVEPWQPPLKPPVEFVAALREAFGLTPMEARIAALVASGVSLMNAALMSAISEGTARNHLKTGMGKAGVSRQAELAALVSRLTG